MTYYLRKLGFFLLTLWAVVTLNFIIPRVQPGDPAEIMVQALAGKNVQLDQAQVQAMRDMLGTPTGSLFSQYVEYLGQLVRGNFGVSYTYYPFKVTEVIGQAFWWTAILITVVQVLAFVIGSCSGFRRVAPQQPLRHLRHLGVDLPRQPAGVLDRLVAGVRAGLRSRLVPHRRGV